MKKFVFIIFAIILLFPTRALANGAGLPPFFMTNGKMSTPNPLQLFGITASTFLIPEDFTPENYVVNQPIHFTIDESQLSTVIPEEALPDTKFSWDFGDGTKADGLDNTHTYTKIGSYILVLNINVYFDANTQAPPTQFIDSFLINVVPYKGFHDLPHAVITLNGTRTTGDVTQTNLGSPIIFNALDSTSKSSIVEYLWDFGDGQTSSIAQVTHTYSQPTFKTVVLRVKDKNGFISDAFVGLENASSQITQAQTASSKTQGNNMMGFFETLFIPIVGIVIIGTFLYKQRTKKKK